MDRDFWNYDGGFVAGTSMLPLFRFGFIFWKHGRIGRRPKLRAKKSYFAFPDLLNENEYQFMTGKRAHALKITPQNAKVYNRMFSQTLGMNILTQEQLERKARKTKATKKKKIF